MRGTMRESRGRKGVWELRVYVGRDPGTNRPKQVSRTFRGSKREAETALAKLVAETTDGKHGGSNTTVANLLDRWLDECQHRTKPISPATVAVYGRMARIISSVLGGTRLSKLGPYEIEQAYRTLRDQGQTEHTMRQAHVALSGALTLAERWGWVQSNPARKIKPPRSPDAEVVAPTGDEVRALVTRLEGYDPDLAHVVLLGALTGCRRGELCALRWSDVDFEGPVLNVRRRLVSASGVNHGERIGTKAGGGRRIALDELAVATLRRLHGLQQARADQIPCRLPKDGYLLSKDGIGGQPRNVAGVSRDVGDHARALGMPHVHLHSLRHYAASELVAAGTDVRTVAGRLGHADPALTLRVYTHQLDERDREAAAVLGRALTPGAANPPTEAGGEGMDHD